MGGQVVQPDAHPLAGKRAHDMDAQLLASRCGLRDARAGLVESRAVRLKGVARPKLLVCHVLSE